MAMTRALVMVAGPDTMSNFPASRPGITLSHGSATTRFNKVNVLNTARKI